MTPEFFLTSLIIIATPGTGALYTVATGLSHGARASFIAAFGCALGTIPHIIAAISGLSALLHTSTIAFQVLKYLGVVYLLYMAWGMFRDRGMLNFDGQETERKSHRQVISSAILINLLNPKLSIFFFAFLPQFILAETVSPAIQMTKLSAVFMVLTLVVFAAYGVLAAVVREYVISNAVVQNWLRRSFAIAFVALAAQLAFAQR